MTDAVTIRVLRNDGVGYVIQITNVSDTGGEAAVKKIDVSAIVGKQGYVVTGVNIDRVSGNVSGFTTVQLLWDASTDDLALVLAEGQHDHNYLKDAGPLIDPRSAGSTGDLLLTTTGNSAGDSYTLLIETTVRYQ